MAGERPTPNGLLPFWTQTVEQFAQLPAIEFTDAEKERHRIYSLLLLAVLRVKWNGNKYGETGNYGAWREGQALGSTGDGGHRFYEGGTYQGHNIAALAVDANGRIIDFDFNHNQVFDSTVEHAESRLVRRVFALNQVYDPWQALTDLPAAPPPAQQRRQLFATAISDRPAPPRSGLDPESSEARLSAPTPYSTLLKDVTIYTSLESCAQCSGIMCLASVKDIVYLQWDQGQFLIGNLMRQATTAQDMGFVAPRPIRGDDFDFDYFDRLNAANDEFSAAVATKPFYDGPGTTSPVVRPSVTSFLCTDTARNIFSEARDELLGWQSAEHGDFRPSATAMSNSQSLTQAHDFLTWVTGIDNRGAPHRV